MYNIVADGTPEFTGGIVYVVYDDLPEEAFVTIAPGETVDSTFDVAKIYDLSEGGEFSFQGQGALQIGGHDNKISHEAAFETNTLTAQVDGVRAAEVQRNLSLSSLEKRPSRMIAALVADCESLLS